MKLSEIAEYVANNYPDCCMSQNCDVIKGCREKWYEESLIEPLLNFYIHEKMGWSEKSLSYDEVVNSYKVNLHIDYNNSIHYGLLQFLMYVLDSYGFTEHGGGIGGCWLTEDGERLLAVLDAWHDSGEYVNE